MAVQRRKQSGEQLGRAAQSEEEGEVKGQHHLVLVPGFGGFDALGSMRYYHGVTDVLHGRGEPGEMAVHYFPNLPTASVQTRAQQLQRWLDELWDRRVFIEGDALHLIGHSTGGLDIRQLLMNWRRQVERDEGGREPPALRLLASIQFLSTPHRGTGIATFLSRTRVRRVACRSLLYIGYQTLRLMGERGASLMGQVLMPRTRADDWIDAIFDTLRGCHVAGGNLEQAHARGSYFNLLRWMLDMASDFNAITDLNAYLPPPGSPASPAHEEKQDRDKDVAFLEERDLRVRSIVTVARPPEPALMPRPIYPLSYFLTAHNPPRRFRACTVRELYKRQCERTLQPSDNDGIVNSVSQVWPDAERSWLVDGDHADVIGHYRSPPLQSDGNAFSWRQYDLLHSPTGFGEKDFIELWRQVADFALRPEEEAGREAGAGGSLEPESPPLMQ